jgi:hypothetical protein
MTKNNTGHVKDATCLVLVAVIATCAPQVMVDDG